MVIVGVSSSESAAVDHTYRIISMTHAGFHYQNLASLNDVALVFLDRCVSGEIAFPLLASKATPREVPCGKATTYGFGRHEIIPPHLFVPDGSLRRLETDQRFHSDRICKDAYTNFAVTSLYNSSPISETAREEIANAINPSIGCYGGDRVAQGRGFPCDGDSGGPVFDEATKTVIGVTSFSSDVCGTLPNYYTRVGAYSDWIYRQILLRSKLACNAENDLGYLVDAGPVGRKLFELHNLHVTAESCGAILSLLNIALGNPKVPVQDIQNACTAFLACIEETASESISEIMDSILSEFSVEVDEIDTTSSMKLVISRIMLCSSTYEDYFNEWHKDAEITFRYMNSDECKDHQ